MENSSSYAWHESVLSWCHRQDGGIYQRLCLWHQALKALSHQKIIEILLLFSSNTFMWSFFTFMDICLFKMKHGDLLFTPQILRQLFYHHLFIFFR